MSILSQKFFNPLQLAAFDQAADGMGLTKAQKKALLKSLEPTWVPVTERMPPLGLPVSVMCKPRGALGTAWYRDAFMGDKPEWALCLPGFDYETGKSDISHWLDTGEK